MKAPAVVAVLAALTLQVCACGGSDGTGPTAPTPVPATPASAPAPAPAPQPPPPSWEVSGYVASVVDNGTVPGASIAWGANRSTSEGNGYYMLRGGDAETLPLTVSANGYVTREAYMRADGQRSVNIELIPTNGFPMALFRQMGRNALEQPTALLPLKRWTVNPNIHIENFWRDTGAPIAQSRLDYFANEIRRAIPLLTDGKLQAGEIRIDGEVWQMVPGYMSVHFDHSATWSTVGDNPGMVQFGGDDPCNSTMVMHEFGHSMGLWHAGPRPTVMGGGILASCSPTFLTPDEQLVTRLLYARPPGNIEPDKDPQGTVFLATGPGSDSRSGVRIIVD